MHILLLHTGCLDWEEWGPGILERRASGEMKGSQQRSGLNKKKVAWIKDGEDLG